jgi:hypothetical protein
MASTCTVGREAFLRGGRGGFLAAAHMMKSADFVEGDVLRHSGPGVHC